MDQFDWKILRILHQRPDIRIADLADEVGLSHTPCWRRLKALEQSGVIAGRAILLSPAHLGLRVNVYAHLRLSRHDEETLDAFASAAKDHPEILDCFSMSGEFDYIMRIITRSIEDYEKFLKRVLLHLPGVSAVNSSFALNAVKTTTALPLYGDPTSHPK